VGGEEVGGEGGRNDPNIVCTYEYKKIIMCLFIFNLFPFYIQTVYFVGSIYSSLVLLFDLPLQSLLFIWGFYTL
jgi:hypothetical protein